LQRGGPCGIELTVEESDRSRRQHHGRS
jgi:hypothetical protein